MTTAQKVNAVRDHIAHTTGTENYYQDMLGIKHTDGAQMIAETCGAFWLLDLIASHQANAKVRREPFQVWRLSYRPENWLAEAWDDTPGESNRLARQVIPYSDFPIGLAPFDLWVESGVILLPAEH